MLMQKIKGDTYYLDASTNIGYIGGLMIDTGIDDGVGKRALRIIEENGNKVNYLINTHTHPDHVGANAVVLKRSGAKMISTKEQQPYLEQMGLGNFFFYGARPINITLSKFTQSEVNKVDMIVEPGELSIGEIQASIVDLKGHSIDQVGIITKDDVFFCADTILTEELLAKHKLPLVVDVEQSLATLMYIRDSRHSFYVPSHAPLSSDMRDLAQKNINIVEHTVNNIYDFCKEVHSQEEIVEHIIKSYDIHMSVQQYFLTQTSVIAYISYLYNKSSLEILLENGRMMYLAK